MQLVLLLAASLPGRCRVGGARLPRHRAERADVAPSSCVEADEGLRRLIARGGVASDAVVRRPDDAGRWAHNAPPARLLDGPETRGEIADEDREGIFDSDVDADELQSEFVHMALGGFDLERAFAEMALSGFERRFNGTRHRCGQAGIELIFGFSDTELVDDQVLVNGMHYLPLPRARPGDPQEHSFLLLPRGPEMMLGELGTAYEVWPERRPELDPRVSVTLTRLRNFEVEEEMHCMQA